MDYRFSAESVVTRADYGIDAPEAVRNLAVGGLVVIAVGVVLWLLLGWTIALIAATATGGFSLIIAALLVSSSKVSKLRECERLLDSLELRGGRASTRCRLRPWRVTGWSSKTADERPRRWRGSLDEGPVRQPPGRGVGQCQSRGSD